MEQKHPTDRQRRFFQDHVIGEKGTILTVKTVNKEPRGFAVNIRGPFILAGYQLGGSSETVIDAEWAGDPESASHLHCCWSEVRFAKLSETNESVRKHIGYQ